MGIFQTPQAIVPASVGGMTLLSTTSLSGTETTVSSISSSYKHLLVVWNKVYGSGNSDFAVRFNGDTGSNYADGQIQYGAYEYNFQESNTNMRCGASSTNSGDKTAWNGYLYIYRYTEGDSKQCNAANWGKYGSVFGMYSSMCNYDSSTAISSISFRTGSAVTFSGGTVYIYGVS